MGITPTEEPNPLPPFNQIRRHAENVLSQTRLEQQQARQHKIRRNLQRAPILGTSHQLSDSTPPTCPAAKAAAAVSKHAQTPVSIPSVPTPPSGLSWVRVHGNMRVPTDCCRDFFVPYLGESDAHLKSSNSLAVALLTGSDDEDNDDSDVEAAQYADDSDSSSLDEQLSDMNDSTTNGMYENAHSLPPTNTEADWEKYSYPAWDRAAKRAALVKIQDTYKSGFNKQLAVPVAKAFGLQSPTVLFAYHANITSRTKRWKQLDEHDRIQAQHQVELKKFISGQIKPSSSEVLKSDSIRVMFCRQCYTYDCPLHELGGRKLPLNIPDRSRKDMKPSKDGVDLEAKCEDSTNGNCWFSRKNESQDAAWLSRLRRNESLLEDLEKLVKELFDVYGEDYCRICAVLRCTLFSVPSELYPTCSRIGLIAQELFVDRLGVPPLAVAQRMKPSAPRTKKNWKDKAKASRQSCSKAESEAMKRGRRLDYVPCKHEGSCTAENCICIQTGVNCEKYCHCNSLRAGNRRTEGTSSCRNAFRGCFCKSAIACTSNACVCYSAGRECDPDLCRSCLDCKEILPQSQSSRSCRNIGLLMGDRHRTIVGRSTVHGWGAFAGSNIPKGDIIGEYVGEVIAQSEAECRGRVYDEVNYSFLFNITTGFAVDSTRLGNKLRFCNHSQTPNCEAKIKRVGGDVRVGLYAKRNIEKNEELFFDYGYNNGPEWAMEGKKKPALSDAKNKKRKERAARKNKVESESDVDEVLPVTRRRRSDIPKGNRRDEASTMKRRSFSGIRSSAIMMEDSSSDEEEVIEKYSAKLPKQRTNQLEVFSNQNRNAAGAKGVGSNRKHEKKLGSAEGKTSDSERNHKGVSVNQTIPRNGNDKSATDKGPTTVALSQTKGSRRLDVPSNRSLVKANVVSGEVSRRPTQASMKQEDKDAKTKTAKPNGEEAKIAKLPAANGSSSVGMKRKTKCPDPRYDFSDEELGGGQESSEGGSESNYATSPLRKIVEPGKTLRRVESKQVDAGAKLKRDSMGSSSHLRVAGYESSEEDLGGGCASGKRVSADTYKSPSLQLTDKHGSTRRLVTKDPGSSSLKRSRFGSSSRRRTEMFDSSDEELGRGCESGGRPLSSKPFKPPSQKGILRMRFGNTNERKGPRNLPLEQDRFGLSTQAYDSGEEDLGGGSGSGKRQSRDAFMFRSKNRTDRVEEQRRAKAKKYESVSLQVQHRSTEASASRQDGPYDYDLSDEDIGGGCESEWRYSHNVLKSSPRRSMDSKQGKARREEKSRRDGESPHLRRKSVGSSAEGIRKKKGSRSPGSQGKSSEPKKKAISNGAGGPLRYLLEATANNSSSLANGETRQADARSSDVRGKPKKDVPIVSLVSDEESARTSGSYEPNFLRWFS